MIMKSSSYFVLTKQLRNNIKDKELSCKLEIKFYNKETKITETFLEPLESVIDIIRYYFFTEKARSITVIYKEK